MSKPMELHFYVVGSADRAGSTADSGEGGKGKKARKAVPGATKSAMDGQAEAEDGLPPSKMPKAAEAGARLPQAPYKLLQVKCRLMVPESGASSADDYFEVLMAGANSDGVLPPVAVQPTMRAPPVIASPVPFGKDGSAVAVSTTASPPQSFATSSTLSSPMSVGSERSPAMPVRTAMMHDVVKCEVQIPAQSLGELQRLVQQLGGTLRWQ